MKLIIEDDEGRKTVVPLVRDEVSIGRHDENLVRLTEKNVSRKHARIVREGASYIIEDLNSFTGVRVNGDKVKGRRAVREGDLIQISEYDLSLQAAPEEKAKPPAPGLGEDDEPTNVSAAKPPPPPDAAAEAQARKNADTAVIRLSDLGQQPADDAAPVEIPVEKRPKLVGVQGTFRGKELVLDRSPIKIGRNEENDVEIDHPSISRKHCRLHLDGDSWKILDAESKNGVRVNGEPYAAIALRHGDVLEIGHLKFAFVAAGQAFKAPASTPAFGSQKAAPSPKGLYIALGVGLAAVLVLGTVLLTRSHGGEDDGVEVGSDAKAERKFALRAAEEAAAGHRYTESLRNFEAARKAGATAAELRSYEQVKAESRSEELYREMESAAASQNWEHARKILDVLAPAGTYYGKKAGEKSDAITAGYVNLHIAAAALMKGKDNAGCLAEAQLALQANGQSADAQSLVDGCKVPSGAIAAASPAPRKAVEPPTAEVKAASVAPAPPAAAKVAAADDSEARKLLNDGNNKLVAQDFASAVGLYQKALSMKPGDTVLSGLYRSLGIAYTRQGNIEEGARYYKLYLPLCTNPAEKAQLEKVLADYEARKHG